MPLPGAAQAVLSAAEAEIQKLIIASAAAGEYQDVTELAAAADTLAKLLRSPPLERVVGEETRTLESTYTTSTRQALPYRRASSRLYPRFERDDDKLVKVAWSKRHRAEYEHRAPRGVADTLLEAIRRRKGEGVKFDAIDVLPLEDARGKEVPSYQAYLALAWLRQEGVVAKHGRSQYSLKPASATSQRMIELWDALPQRCRHHERLDVKLP
jgi:hypothetical protein